ncbi:hypothetical protein FB451DRAFT_791639 [Mycena latifolia]|nr:hypothetical protein FB451DRAFT_791639 [Mycena latifolia]
MRFLSAIYISSILSLAAVGAPLTHPARGDVITKMSREDHNASELTARMGSDAFEELDLTAREPDVEVEARILHTEPQFDRGSQSGGCVIA